ncbi:guanine nucleotide-binding protein G(o) subunit alpha [Trichonephila inaurata madagascariensis]|uniref:Adenylate cyclase-stimulating G alpha protein n=1 Tax=Trichonephila inaurata madagascariensis TaxID=2747483 RepID=A0A8X6JSB5_9ARAC|nr:guanine nucleotide-binding protein G(o) subunit alpha [Trichonephila inaurata madagascariensis]
MAQRDYKRAGSIPRFVEFLKEARDLSDQRYLKPRGIRAHIAFISCAVNQIIMGCTVTTQRAEDARNNNRGKKPSEKEKNELMREVKLLLMGGAGSGKSTIVRQMTIHQENGLTEDECRRYKPIIYSNVIEGMVTILRAMNTMDIPFDTPQRQRQASLLIEIFQNKLDDEPFTEEVQDALNQLWKDSGVLRCFDRSNEYQLNDNMKYFFDQIDRLAEDHFMPTVNDILRTRVRTAGIVETNLFIQDLHFRLLDVSGRHSESRRWMNCFKDASAIIFCAPLSEYDQWVDGDAGRNRLKESMELFKAIWNNKYFKNTSMILFLNKKDLFKEKITRSQFKDYFPQYNGPNDFNNITAFIQAQFEACNDDRNKEVYPHLTCATEESDIKFTFQSVANVIMAKNLNNHTLY